MDPDCSHYKFMAADETAIYYYNADDERIEKSSVANPASGPVILASVGSHAPSTDLMIKDGNLYYGTSFREIMRLSVEGGAPSWSSQLRESPMILSFWAAACTGSTATASGCGALPATVARDTSTRRRAEPTC